EIPRCGDGLAGLWMPNLAAQKRRDVLDDDEARREFRDSVGDDAHEEVPGIASACLHVMLAAALTTSGAHPLAWRARREQLRSRRAEHLSVHGDDSGTRCAESEP